MPDIDPRHHSSDGVTLVLVHGGLWGESDAERFWHRPGIVRGLSERGFTVLAPERPRRPADWADEARHLAGALPDRPVFLVAGSNGCSAAVRVAAQQPGSVRGVMLAWPATAGDASVDRLDREQLAGVGATEPVVDALLAGETLRGTTDADLAALRVPVGVMASVPSNPHHQRHTVDALLRLVPGAVELPGSPEAPVPWFAEHLPDFLATVERFAAMRA
ncbi:alpha/beta fold hydrolase [Rugosimonospora africana]|uniref:Alpha/beta hydrolase family protein n=1 Tax=Rugosimonospora africana TaxID=556532 RepID=A0A8J3QWC6_9ACTN|nr:alpha/beta hydrolase [Rugosimonospora africana]GIH18078.1 hypothetical protein Raf01_62500 [Rugosimonospora africana]